MFMSKNGYPILNEYSILNAIFAQAGRTSKEGEVQVKQLFFLQKKQRYQNIF